MIFCQTVNDIVAVLCHFLFKLGTTGMYADGDAPPSERCLIGVYYSQSPKCQKSHITQSFEGNGFVRVIIASSSLSMGVDFPHVSYVLHYGPSKGLSSHLQEAGRAGRDGSQAFNITTYLPKHLIHCEKQVKVTLKTALNNCARISFFENFDKHVKSQQPLHACCSVCHKSCKCGEDGQCSVPLYVFDSLPEMASPSNSKCRKITSDDKKCLGSALRELQLSLSHNVNTTFLDPSGSSVHGLSDTFIKKVVDNGETIFTVADVIMYSPITSFRLALMILEVFNEIFEDITIPDDAFQIVQVSEPITNVLEKETDSILPINNFEDEFEDLFVQDYSSDELPE